MDFQHDILAVTPQYREKHLLETVTRVLDAARHTSATIVYITVSFRDDYADAPAHSPLFQAEKARGVMKVGSPGAAICEELTPQTGDLVINKPGSASGWVPSLSGIIDELARDRTQDHRGACFPSVRSGTSRGLCAASIADRIRDSLYLYNTG
jgi:nicotinamidase-related amidase